jgi:hypothetical protein
MLDAEVILRCQDRSLSDAGQRCQNQDASACGT